MTRRLVPRGARNWLRAPSLSVMWLADEARHALGLNPVVRLRPDWPLRCHPAALRVAFLPACADAEQARELDGFIASCAPGMRLFDIGAHFGLFTLAALHYGGSAAQVVAVDPSPAATRMLRIQADLNGIADRMTIVEAALGDRVGQAHLVPVGVIAAGYYAPPQAGGFAEARVVAALTLDALAARHGWPTHVKIDVEGAEADVLAGAHDVLAHTPAPVLFVELHNEMVRGCGGDPGRATAALAAAGYEIFDLDGRTSSANAILARPLTRIVARRRAA
ncbi:MAG: FkbM family methyltransferase [Gemmatimonadales bacterium]